MVCQRYALLFCLSLLFWVGGCTSTPPLEKTAPPGFQGFYQPTRDVTLAEVAQQLGLGQTELARFNPRSQETPLSRQRPLRLPERNADAPAAGPYYYRIQAGDTLSSLARHFHLALLSLMQANPGLQPERLAIGQRIVIPVQGRDLNGYRWPVSNPQIRIDFSQQRWGLHQGLALETTERQEVFPIAPGRVVFAGEMRGFGRVIIVEHSQQRQSIYAYCHALFVEEQNRLSGRHPVCSAGHQRQLNRPGIYFELREQGQAVSPKNYLPALPWQTN